MTRKSVVFAVLGAFFLTNALVAEMIGGKLIYVGDPSWRFGPFGSIPEIGPFQMSVGIIPWPVVFLTTDLINEYFGRRGVRRLTFLTVAMIAYAFVILAVTRLPEATPLGVDGDSFDKVFGQSQWIIVGSVTAFLASQLLDVFVFQWLRRFTGKSMLWLRATGSTVVSQMIDSVIVLYIGLALPMHWDWSTFIATAIPNYTVKLVIAVLATPLIYLGHWIVEKYLGKEAAEEIAASAARNESDGVKSAGS